MAWRLRDVGVQVADDDELALLGLRELDEPARLPVRGRRPQGGVDGEEVVDRLAQHLQGRRPARRRLFHTLLLGYRVAVMGAR